jgi:hypothetical protein
LHIVDALSQVARCILQREHLSLGGNRERDAIEDAADLGISDACARLRLRSECRSIVTGALAHESVSDRSPWPRLMDCLHHPCRIVSRSNDLPTLPNMSMLRIRNGAASSANIPTETVSGDISGTMTITGQVDQGVSANKQTRLNEALAMYDDTAGIVYTTDPDAGLATLDMSLQGIPTGSLSGSLNGTYDMVGSLQGEVTLAVTFSGSLESSDAGTVERQPGTTHVTGTATSGSGTYTIDVTR